MTLKANQEQLTFENVWQKVDADIQKQVLSIWKLHEINLTEPEALARTAQLVYVIRNEFNQVVGMSTGFKAYIKQLRNHFYAIRLFIMPGFRKPGLTSKLLVMTRDFFEDIHKEDKENQCIGIITLVENEKLKEHRNEAIWPASKMVYLGNSGKGHHIRVYYFKGTRILP